MHFPVQFEFGSLKLSLHLIFEMLGFIVGFRYFLFLRERDKDNIPDANRTWIIIAATFGSFFFSRLVGAFENPEGFYNAKNHLLYFYANKTIIGGLLGGLLLVEVTKKIINERSSSGDLFTYPLIFAMIIGRIGCFTSGIYEQTYGNVTNSIFGMDLGDGLHRHPVALYEIAFLMLLWLVLRALEKWYVLINGYRFQIFMIAYLTFRLLLDFIKPRDGYLLGLGTIQIVCILGLLYYSKTVLKIIFNPKKLILNAK